VTLVAGMRVRSRVDATTYRRWIKFALLAMAAILVVQFFALLAACRTFRPTGCSIRGERDNG
jgi:hypothetical protein